MSWVFKRRGVGGQEVGLLTYREVAVHVLRGLYLVLHLVKGLHVAAVYREHHMTRIVEQGSIL